MWSGFCLSNLNIWSFGIYGVLNLKKLGEFGEYIGFFVKRVI